MVLTTNAKNVENKKNVIFDNFWNLLKIGWFIRRLFIDILSSSPTFHFRHYIKAHFGSTYQWTNSMVNIQNAHQIAKFTDSVNPFSSQLYFFLPETRELKQPRGKEYYRARETNHQICIKFWPDACHSFQ